MNLLAQIGSSTDKPRCRKISDQRRGAFTLAEVMLGSVLLAFVIVSSLAIISHCSAYLADLRLRSRGSQFLQQEVEQLRTKSWSQLQSFPTTFTDPADSNNVFRGFVTLSSYQSYGGTTTVLRATVSVTWINRHHLAMTNSLTTLTSNGG